MIVASFASAFVEGVGGASIYVTLAVVRFILGFGIGGEYPLAATITSESSAAASRGRSNALVFSMQGVGLLVAPCLALALFDTLGTDYDTMWRLLLGAGCVPGLVTIYWRLRMHETPHFTLAASFKESMTPAYKFRLIRRNARALAGTALNWLLLDIVFYANGLFSGIILSQAHFVTSADPAAALRETIVASIYLALVAVPGYFCAVAIIDKHGRKPLQLWGFIAMAVRCCCPRRVSGFPFFKLFRPCSRAMSCMASYCGVNHNCIVGAHPQTLYIILGALTVNEHKHSALVFITLCAYLAGAVCVCVGGGGGDVLRIH